MIHRTDPADTPRPTTRQSVLRDLDHAVRRAAVCAASSPSISCRRSSAPSPSTRPRSRRSPAMPSRRPSTTPSWRWRTQRPRARSASTTCSTSWPAPHTNDALLAIEREIAPRIAAHWNSIRMNEALFARIDALYRQARQPRPRPPSRRACWSATTPCSAAPAPALDADEQEAARRDHRAAGDARHRVQPERARRRAVLHAGARRRGRPRRPARFRARGRARRRRASAA